MIYLPLIRFMLTSPHAGQFLLMYHLGIFGGNGPNPAAALLHNGKLVVFGEEERFCRIKKCSLHLD